MTASDSETCKETEKIVTVHDTTVVQVMKRDTIRLRDTVATIKRDTLRLRDTVIITKRDTLKIHDTTKITIRDTILKRDTLRIHDTTKITVRDTVLASFPDPNAIWGVWDGQAQGKRVVLAFTTSITNDIADFSASIGTTSTSGSIKQLDSAQAKVRWSFHDVTWLMDLRDGVLKIQEIGDMMLPGGEVTLRKR
jgi:hypothetical protein